MDIGTGAAENRERSERDVSRAFVKEEQFETRGAEAPVRVESGLPKYITPFGLARLSERVENLRAARAAAVTEPDSANSQERLAALDRELRDAQGRLDGAIPVDIGALPEVQVHFGSEVSVVDEDGRRQCFVIVGEDEADPHKGWVSWASPLGRALMNARVGEAVTWLRPSGNRELEIAAIRNARFEEHG